MARSVKKGPYIQASLQKKVRLKNCPPKKSFHSNFGRIVR